MRANRMKALFAEGRPALGCSMMFPSAPLVEMLGSLDVGTLFLELCTPRAGEMDVLKTLPRTQRIGVGVVNQKHPRIETVDEIVARGREAIRLFGAERVLLTPDCGFATFADNPVSSAAIAEAFTIGAASQRIAKENFVLAVAYNVLAVPVAMAGLASPLIAALAMSTSSIIVVANALRVGWGGRRRAFRLDAATGPAATATLEKAA